MPRAYVGTYTRSGRAQGIYVFEQDPDSGNLILAQTVTEVDPTWIELDRQRRFLYTVTEGVGRDQGGVAAYAVHQATGRLEFINRQPTHGGEPCHLCIDPTGRWLLVANHEHGSVAVLPIDSSHGLGPATDVRQHTGSGPGPTQKGPHAHHVTFDPRGERVLVTDKGIDQVVVYRLDADAGKLVPNSPPAGLVHAGAAPRHLAFGSSGRFVYVNGEADMTVSVLSYDQSSGALSELQTLSTLPEGARGEAFSTAEVVIEPSGRFVYVSNRGHDSMAIFRIDSASGLLSVVGHEATRGKTPRFIGLDPSGTRLYAANQNSDTIVQFSLDPESGRLTATGDVTHVGAPACVAFS
jgi:6-phosphogluconolactonase